MNRWTAPCLASASLLLAACQYNPHAHRFSKRQPTVEEAAGTYVLTEALVDTVKTGLSAEIKDYAATSRIILRHDGSAKFVRFPDFSRADDFTYSYKGPKDFEGRWSIVASGTVSSGGDDSQTVYGIDFSFADGRKLFESPTFTGSSAVDGVIFTLGDPDMGEILGFKKQ
ncbi:hypothetical protein OKA04_06480 [Luteolibacter flavescens]|uniref:Lipoprotein n=1 Tax=Luteolibacter flavescens TaxID=1859460 RepID=A0ABT3FLC8_9BACT|nr:hypothetical protein [Luteolibacter flavescens]MCW1884371.1 hypothetical protein [Luteolibacter flavescens]